MGEKGVEGEGKDRRERVKGETGGEGGGREGKREVGLQLDYSLFPQTEKKEKARARERESRECVRESYPKHDQITRDVLQPTESPHWR